MTFIRSTTYSKLLVQCLFNGFKTIYLQNPSEIHQWEVILKPHFAPPAWILTSFSSPVKKSWDETKSIPFLSSYPTVIWLGHNAGVWERKGLNSLGLWSSCADWWSLTTLGAMLEESPPQVFTQRLCCCHHPAVSWQKQASLCPSSSRAKVQCPPTNAWWRQVCGKVCGVFLHKISWDEHPGQGPPALLGEKDLWQVDGNRPQNLWNHTLNWFWECKSKPWYKLNWCSFCVHLSPLIFELPKGLRDHYVR